MPQAVCGNGDIEVGEECDDTNAVEDDGCNTYCERTARFAFVSSSLWVGGELTLESADATCNTIGNTALGNGYPATQWRAWMSGSGVGEGALERLGESFMPLVMPGNHKLASSYSELGTGVLQNPFNYDELGNKIGFGIMTCDDASALVWTFTAADGTKAITCDEAASATLGSANDPGVGWTEMCDFDCGGFAHLYCIEVES